MKIKELTSQNMIETIECCKKNKEYVLYSFITIASLGYIEYSEISELYSRYVHNKGFLYSCSVKEFEEIQQKIKDSLGGVIEKWESKQMITNCQQQKITPM